MKHIMIDLETLGRPPDGAIIALGAVLFDTNNGKIESEFLRIIDPKSAVRYCSINVNTVLWWLEQDKKVRDYMFSGRATLETALSEFVIWYISHNAKRIWAKSITFDITLLNHALNSYKMEIPYSYRDVRDMRWFKDVIPNLEEATTNNETEHNALNDARYQANVVIKAYKALNVRDIE